MGGWYFDSYGPDNFGWNLLTGAEELLEMSGVALLLYALLDYAWVRFPGVRLVADGGAAGRHECDEAAPSLPHSAMNGHSRALSKEAAGTRAS